MDLWVVYLISILLLVVGILGTFLPMLPGLLLSLCGILVYKFGASSSLSMVYIWIFVALTLVSAILNYIIPAKTTRKFGGTKWGSIGSVLGTIAGLFFIPIPFGFLLGMFLGVFISELLHDFTDKKKAINSVKGAFVGFVYGVGFNFLVGLSMLFVVLYDMFFN